MQDFLTISVSWAVSYGETARFSTHLRTGLPEIYVSAAASIRQRKIGAAEGEELFVIALLGDAAVLDDGDAVGIANG